MRNSVSRPQVSRRRSASPFNRCQNLSAVVGHRATMLQPHPTVDGGQAMTAGVPSIIARIHRRLRGLAQSSRRPHQPSPELLQPSRGFHQPFLHVSQPSPDANQPLKEAYQSLQDAEKQHFGFNQPKTGFFGSTANHANHAKESLVRVFGVFRGCLPPSYQPSTLN